MVDVFGALADCRLLALLAKRDRGMPAIDEQSAIKAQCGFDDCSGSVFASLADMVKNTITVAVQGLPA